jgi:hypothetical protein
MLGKLEGKLDAMSEKNEMFQTEAVTTLREIRDAFTKHTAEDSKEFEKIHVMIAEARGKVKMLVAIGGVALTGIGLVASKVLKALGW